MKDKLNFSEELKQELNKLERIDLFDNLYTELVKLAKRKNVLSLEREKLNEFCEKLNGQKGAYDCYDDIKKQYEEGLEEALEKAEESYSLIKTLNKFN